MLILVLILVFALCFAVYNYWFQKEKYRRLSEPEIKKLNAFNAPYAWLIYSIFAFLALLGIISYYVYQLMTTIMEMQK